MKNVQCWPFLVSSNRCLDYRTIVAPDFICESGNASILANAAGGNLTEENEAFYREIEEEKLTLVYRVVETTFEEMGIKGSGDLKDSFGREIRLIEGIVIKKESVRDEVTVTKDDLEKAHKMVIEPYREFWECISSQPVTPSESFSLPQDSSQPSLEYHEEEPYVVETVEFRRDETTFKPSPETLSKGAADLQAHDRNEALDTPEKTSIRWYIFIQDLLCKLLKLLNKQRNKQT